MNTPRNLVVIIREVGREVCLFSHPVTFDVPLNQRYAPKHQHLQEVIDG